MALNGDAARCQTVYGIFIGNPFHLHLIGPRVSCGRIQKPMIEARLVPKEQQTLRIKVQPPNGINSFRKTKLCQRSLARLVRCKLAKHTIGFVKGDQHGLIF